MSVPSKIHQNQRLLNRHFELAHGPASIMAREALERERERERAYKTSIEPLLLAHTNTCSAPAWGPVDGSRFAVSAGEGAGGASGWAGGGGGGGDGGGLRRRKQTVIGKDKTAMELTSLPHFNAFNVSLDTMPMQGMCVIQRHIERGFVFCCVWWSGKGGPAT